MTLSRPQAVIFDWDNTLVNTWPIIHAALNATLKEYGHAEWTFDMTRSRVKKSMRDSFPEIFGADWQKVGEFYQQQYRNQHLIRLEALPDAVVLLDYLKQRGLYCVVVSNKKGENLRTEVAHLGWGHYFDKVVGATDAERDKPFADPVQLAFIDRPELLNEHAWFIGDSEIDLECAKNVGTGAVLYGEFARSQADCTDSSFGGFPYDSYVADHSETIALFERFR